MKVTVLREAGVDEALLGLSLSYNQQPDKMKAVADRLAHKGGGESKFLESIAVWIDITAPRYWWAQFSTYRIGTSCQSESTMHTLMSRHLTQDDFEYAVPDVILNILNGYIDRKIFNVLKGMLPEAFLQRRIVCTNYATLQRIINQRKNHRLVEWPFFCNEILTQVNNPGWIAEAN